MNKYVVILCVLLAPFFISSTVQSQNLPIKEWATNSHDKPLIFYISGDGGLNDFSTSLCEEFYKKGFDVSGLNSRSYFWDKKTPQKTADDINSFLTQKLSGRKNQQIVLVGYSFGADVLPFILNRLSKTIDDKILVSFLMASSGNTDFEIHWSDIFGGNSKRNMDVVTEINKLTHEKIVILSGSDDKTLAVNKITLKRFTREMLPGGHHFDGDTQEVARVILNDIQ
ncbi:MAG: AcvB/VirJ family lysyl-phosphatidylglycerol hydrolase [Ginsengibacter sp.]